MKHLLVILLLLIPVVGYSQYISPANIYFDPSILQSNVEAWESYQTYSKMQNKAIKKANRGIVIELIGCGLLISSICLVSANDSSAQIIGLFSSLIGLGCTFGGYSTYLTNNNKIYTNKKDFILYLKTNHNGLGIVSVF